MSFLKLGKILLLASLSTGVYAQSVIINVNPSIQTGSISPLIYGYNAYADGTQRAGLANQGGLTALQSLNLTSRRLGGNAMTSYNWENGVSNSGADWCNSSNAGVSAMAGAGNPNMSAQLAYYTPGAALLAFQQQSLQLKMYSLLQLPAAGALPKNIVDLNPPGVCEGSPLWQDSPGPANVDTSRWSNLVFNKPLLAGNLTLSPNLADSNVYVDEEINFLTQTFGRANSSTGIKGYELDNEPDLWHHYPAPDGDAGTHTHLHPNLSTVSEVMTRSINLANTVKRMDSTAETFGPAISGYLGLYSLWMVWDGVENHQPADWATYSREPFLTNKTGDVYRYNGMTMSNVYLSEMQAASLRAGQRLLDVFSVHYYAQASADPVNRVQAPRSLWDPTYVEPSWITQVGNGFTNGRALQFLPKLKQSISDFYPGTKLAITEYDFGGNTDITGAIAQADALGIFGTQGVYLATYFGDAEGFIASAFKIYRNYDGKNSSFPATAVQALSSNLSNCAVYAAVNPANPGSMNVIVINRATTAQTTTINIGGTTIFNSASVWGVSGAKPAVTARPAVKAISNNTFNYTVPASSVLHFVLKS